MSTGGERVSAVGPAVVEGSTTPSGEPGARGAAEHWTVRVPYFLLRVVSGLLLFQAGAMKFLGWYGGMPGQAGSTAPLMSQLWIGGVLEFFGGLALMLGLATRPAAFLLSGQMAVAYWQFHAPNGTWPIQNHGGPAVLLCFILLYVWGRGGGAWSLDTLLRRLPRQA